MITMDATSKTLNSIGMQTFCITGGKRTYKLVGNGMFVFMPVFKLFP